MDCADLVPTVSRQPLRWAAYHAPDMSSAAIVGAALDMPSRSCVGLGFSATVAARLRRRCAGGRFGVGPVPSGSALCIAENYEPILSNRAGTDTGVPWYWADYGLVYMKTGAHPPGEPAVPGGERADAGVPAAAALPPGHAVLLDRELERGQIDRVLELARQGRSAALVLQGEPGTGKTTLLDYAVESGRDFEIVRVLGIESEAELGFAALHQLVLPFAGQARVSSGTAAGRSGRGARPAPCGFAGPLSPGPRGAYHAGRRRHQAAAAVHRR